MLLSCHTSYGALLRSFGLHWLLASSRDIKEQWEWRTDNDVIPVIPKNGVGTAHMCEELAGGKSRVAYQKFVIP